MNFRRPCELTGRHVRIIPLEADHAAALLEIGRDPGTWTYMATGPISTLEDMQGLIGLLVDRERKGTDLPFTVVRRSDGQAVGMTRFLEIDRPHRRVEVGGTWLGERFRRTPFNADEKLLMLSHAFEEEGANRVQLKTDLRNLRSQRAIERIGATREGVLRAHMVMPDGFVRSSVVYSIVAEEWPTVRQGLERLLARPWTPSAGTA